MARQNLVDQKFLERLERLTLRWRKSFPGLVGGHNPSRYPGAGMEFLDHRHFHHGDDLRAVNWRAYLRFEKLFLKMFQVEPSVPVRLLLDQSASMGIGNPSKFDYARKLAAALCYVGLVRLDTISVEPYGVELLEGFTCSGGRHRFAPVADFLAGLKAGGGSDCLKVVRQFLARRAQRSLVIVISDFLDPPTESLKPYQILSDYGHELLLIQVWASEDRTPPWEGDLDLVDAETGGLLRIPLDAAAREEHTRQFDAYCREVRSMALRNGGRYLGVETSVPLEEAVFGEAARVGGLV